MEKGDKLEWEAPEYEEKVRSRDWFWALGVVVVAGSLASVIYGNYFFAALLILGGGMLGFFAVKKPDIVDYELNDKGLRIRTSLYPYETLSSFFVRADDKPMLFVKSSRAFMPIISIPIMQDYAETIHNIFLSKNIPEEEMQEHASEKIMEVLGF